MEICRLNYFGTSRIPSSVLFLIVIFLLIWPNSMGKPTLLQAFAQNSTMAINTAKLLASDAIQALNHKDLNGGLEHLKLIVQQLGISGNSTSNSSLVSHLRTHIPAITSKQSALYTGSEAHAQANMTSSNATAAGGANMTQPLVSPKRSS
jgi:hypothetical protein